MLRRGLSEYIYEYPSKGHRQLPGAARFRFGFSPGSLGGRQCAAPRSGGGNCGTAAGPPRVGDSEGQRVRGVGRGGASRRRILVMSFVTASLLEVPLPVTAALTSDGVWSATGMPRRAAAAMTTPDAWATPMTVLTFNWEKTRSTARTSGL